MSNKLIKSNKSNNIEFIIVDVIEFRKQTRFPDGVWDLIKDFIGFFTRPHIVPRWIYLRGSNNSKLCLEIHWNCKECNKSIKTQHNPNKRKIKLLLNEITYHQICMCCDGTMDNFQKKRTGLDMLVFSQERNTLRIQDNHMKVIMSNY